MGKFNLAQAMDHVQPMDVCRRELKLKQDLAKRISDLRKDGKTQGKKTVVKENGKPRAKAGKKNPKKEILSKLVGKKGITKQHLALLSQLQNQLIEQDTNSQDLQETMESQSRMSAKLRKLQHKEIDSVEDDASVEAQLQNMASRLLGQVNKPEEEEEGWVTAGEEEEEEEEEEHGKTDDDEHEKSKILKDKFAAMVRENKNLEKIRCEKKESLERYKYDQNKKMEAAMENMRKEQKKLLQQMTSLAGSITGGKRPADDYSDGGEEEEEEEEYEGSCKNPSKRAKTSQSEKNRVGAGPEKKNKSKNKKSRTQNESDLQLRKYLESLQ